MGRKGRKQAPRAGDPKAAADPTAVRTAQPAFDNVPGHKRSTALPGGHNRNEILRVVTAPQSFNTEHTECLGDPSAGGPF